jgi:predicted Na+-dependent transporter
VTKALIAASRSITPLALAAAALALALPSGWMADNSDLLLALLVLLTALGIPARRLAQLRHRAGELLVLSLGPFVLLAAGAWLLGRPFAKPVRDGLLAVGLASSEVASVALVALARADATIALGAVAGSLVVSAIAGPLVIGALAATSGGGSAHLLGRFALVVLVPLAAGVLVRSRMACIERRDAEREGAVALTVVALVYAALSGARGGHDLFSALLASVLFLALGALLGLLWWSRGPAAAAVPGAFAIGLRDFAVAAALATQAFGPAAGAVPGVYGVLMLIAGAIVASRLARMPGNVAQMPGGT